MGPLSLDLLLHVYFMQRYSRLIEESASSTAHYTWLLVYAVSFLLCLAPLLSIPFLGQALSSTLVYIWSRRNPDTRLSFMGLLVFRAPFLPWFLIGFSFVLHGSIPKDEICGIVVGHSESYLELRLQEEADRHAQFTTSSMTYFRPCTTTVDRLIHRHGGVACSRGAGLWKNRRRVRRSMGCNWEEEAICRRRQAYRLGERIRSHRPSPRIRINSRRRLKRLLLLRDAKESSRQGRAAVATVSVRGCRRHEAIA